MDLHTAVTVSMLPVSRGRACAVFKELREADAHVPAAAVLARFGVPPPERPALLAAAAARADRALRAAASCGMEPIAWFDPRYPRLLGCIEDPPPVLWLRGQAAVLERPIVAIVGSRAATTYAIDVAWRLATDLARRGVVVASGLARGVDSAAHRGALEAGGGTVAVLGSGLDRVYPREHGDLADTIGGTGVVMSELGPGGPPLAEHFPLRNRIISGISLGVVVVEASEKSGSLITARCAMEQGRDVMAVPGSVLTGRNRGSHALLKDGARVVETADDMLDGLGWPGAGLPPGTRHAAGGHGSSDPLLSRFEAGESYDLDTLVQATGMSGAELLTRLMELELGGYVRTEGGRFARRPGNP